ncbi:putative BZIP transcription factor [Taphrina deformans PYCC 5710]|uniref:BZIP transcription factor n=1 Tax=Taphrina deformans (strain PYCC 5710 / ATCC 11124 / CBS 356.35 / IMI 108563 / JCM 9778 / NBRC 8474) TaxID=1097556 RepID=R4X966_TAPDE|nr:putative BZIP transcription factor [Taphrina deformans PYCC 5710]|eukprot:CCG82251.1 putative BZIP transcription factor [Taphrina deformans PYCC 5710]
MATDIISRPTLFTERSGSDEKGIGQNLDDLTAYDRYSTTNWDPSILLEEPFALPLGVTHLHDKHELDSIDRVESESKRQELGQDSGKKKPGRKPILEEPTTKRKAQNRAAQRAFRERKENHVKELETRVAELEQQNDHQSHENQLLRAELAKIQGKSVDSNFAQSADFTFNFASDQSVRSDSHSSPTGIPPLQNIPQASDCPSLCSSHTSPQSAIEKDFNAATMPFFSRNDSYAESHNSSSDSGVYSLSTNETTSSGLVSLESPFTTLKPDTTQMPFSLSNAFNAQPLEYNFNALDYRDTGMFNSFDNDPPLFETQGMLAAFGSPKVEFDLFAASEPVTNQENEAPVDAKPVETVSQIADTASARDTKPDGPCQQVWQRIVSHPKFATFDLDLLCEEFQNKNKCSQNPDKPFSERGPETWKAIDLALDEFATRQESHRASPSA